MAETLCGSPMYMVIIVISLFHFFTFYNNVINFNSSNNSLCSYFSCCSEFFLLHLRNGFSF